MYRIKMIITDEDNNPINKDYISVQLPFVALTENWLIGLINSLYLLIRRNNDVLGLVDLYPTIDKKSLF